MSAAAIEVSFRPTPAEIKAWAAELEGKDPDVVIRFAWQHFRNNLAVATQFGADGCTLLHRVSRIAPAARFFTIDTGLLFHETYALASALEAKLGITIERVQPERSVAEQAVTYGPNLWERDPDLCCTLRKVAPMKRALSGMGAWMTAVRREQSPTRRELPAVQWDEKFGLVKFCPLVAETETSVEAYALEHEVPLNPLRKLGYLSLGCLTCTRPVKEGEDQRAGRWWRTDKVECGIHK